MEFRMQPQGFVVFFVFFVFAKQSSGSSFVNCLMIVVLQKSHEIQGSQSKFNESNVYIYIYIYIYIICKQILSIAFLNEPYSVFNIVRWF